MILSCNGICKKIHKRSQSPAFKGLAVGDVIIFSTEIKAVGRNKGTYAAYIKCLNPCTKEVSELSFNQIGRVLDNFEFEQEIIRYADYL
jgi:ASC-1-like (ASCH) protein